MDLRVASSQKEFKCGQHPRLFERISEGGAPTRLKKLRTVATWIDNVDCKMDAAVTTSWLQLRKVDR